jgi:hypothetical protein
MEQRISGLSSNLHAKHTVAKVRKTVASISEPAVLEGLVTRVLDVDNWAELFAE